MAACALLVALALVQDPGLLAADTKFDLVTDPAGWLARSLHLWDAEGGFGQIQNQAFGYLWPMGPFFLLGTVLDLPGWLVQRLWQGLVMSVAMVGTAKLARALGVRSDTACLVASFAFALSPRMLTSLGPISIEVWPSALAPWVLLPLVRGAAAGSPRRAAALSALAIGMVGGVNAAATAAVLPLGAVWLLTRSPGPRRRAMMLWWPVMTALATLWWLVPLAIMGAYIPPFLDYTESAAATTFPTTVFDALRGTSHWVPYGDLTWRAGNDVLRTSWLILYDGVLLLLAVGGLAHRRTPHRTFLVVSLLLGVLLVTFGHQGAVHGWFAAPSSSLLDGALAPLRNLHKLDPLIRLPLVLGLAFFVDRLVVARSEQTRAPRSEWFNRQVLLGAVVLALAGTAVPVLTGRVEQTGATLGIPDYWEQAADYVAAHDEDGTSLLVPGSRFAEYVWGDTGDEPMEWLADSRWAVRNVAILAEPGSIRMLDGIEERFADGRGSAGLADQLRRAGVEHLVVRNDLRPSDDTPDPVLVHQALATTPGLARVAAFGPFLGSPAHLDDDGVRVLINDGWQARYQAIEVYDVTAPGATAVSAGEPTVVAGGPEDLPDLLDNGVLDPAPVQLATDVQNADELATPPRRVVLTDGLRARERAFARIHDGYSAVLTPGNVRHTSNRARDYLVDGAERWSTRAELRGAAAVSASSSLSDADTAGGTQRGRLPYAALDGAPDTSWASRPGTGERASWRLDLDEPRAVAAVTITAADDIESQVVRVVTARGRSSAVRLTAGGTRRVSLPVSDDSGDSEDSDDSDEVGWVEIQDASEIGDGVLGLAEVLVPGVDVSRVLRLPALPQAWGAPDVVSLRADHDDRTGCVQVGVDTRCAARRARASEDGPVMRRTFALGESQDYRASVTARPRAGPDLDALLLRGQPAGAIASSTAAPDPRAGAVAAIDGDRSTTWLASLDDQQPTLTLSWLGRQRVTGIDLSVDPDVAAALPDRVLLRFFRASRTIDREVELGADGRVELDPLRADGVEIRVQTVQDVDSIDFAGRSRDVPVGIGDVDVIGVPYLPLTLPVDRVEQECGTGPTVSVGADTSSTALVASPAELYAGAEVSAVPCADADVSPSDVLALPAGDVDVDAERSDVADVAGLVLTSTADPGFPAAALPAPLRAGGPVRRSVDPAEGAAVVALRENANAGWVAEQGGRALRPVTLDGWQQGFVLDGDGPVTSRFGPDAAYRWSLLAGGLAVAALLAVLVLTRRRWRGPVPPPVGERRLGRPVAVVLALGAAGLVGSTTGLVLAAVVVGVTVVLAARLPDVVPWVVAAPVFVAAAAYAVQPWGSTSGWAGATGWVGYLSVVSVAGIVASVGSAGPAPLRTGGLGARIVRRRIPGTSTRR